MELPRPLQPLLRRWPLWLGLLWTGYFLWTAYRNSARERIGALVDPPYVSPDMVEHFRRLYDWQTPLMLAATPLCSFVAWKVTQLIIQRGGSNAPLDPAHREKTPCLLHLLHSVVLFGRLLVLCQLQPCSLLRLLRRLILLQSGARV
jgi:hypothetical protein